MTKDRRAKANARAAGGKYTEARRAMSSNMIPCMNPLVCGVSQHRSNSTAASNCSRQFERHKSEMASGLRVPTPSGAPSPTINAKIMSREPAMGQAPCALETYDMEDITTASGMTFTDTGERDEHGFPIMEVNGPKGLVDAFTDIDPEAFPNAMRLLDQMMDADEEVNEGQTRFDTDRSLPVEFLPAGDNVDEIQDWQGDNYGKITDEGYRKLHRGEALRTSEGYLIKGYDDDITLEFYQGRSIKVPRGVAVIHDKQDRPIGFYENFGD